MAKTAVITGAASGIGLRTMERLLADGWSVWGFDRFEQGLAELETKLAVGKRYRWEKCDVADVQSIKAAFRAVAAEADGLDAVVCSAGVTITGSLEATTPAEVDLMLDVNFKGPWLTTQAALPLLRKKADLANPARVVFVGSISGMRPKVGAGIYGATKAAVHVITGVFAVELGPEGIVVNAVAPGSTDTPMMRAAAAEAARGAFKVSGDSPLGRIARPDDIADAILFFLSDAAKFVNGTVLPVDGGTRAAFLKT